MITSINLLEILRKIENWSFCLASDTLSHRIQPVLNYRLVGLNDYTITSNPKSRTGYQMFRSSEIWDRAVHVVDFDELIRTNVYMYVFVINRYQNTLIIEKTLFCGTAGGHQYFSSLQGGIRHLFCPALPLVVINDTSLRKNLPVTWNVIVDLNLWLLLLTFNQSLQNSMVGKIILIQGEPKVQEEKRAHWAYIKWVRFS